MAKRSAILAEHLLGHVIDLMDDAEQIAVLVQHRYVERAPIAQLEAATFALGPRNVVAGNGHAIRYTGLQYPLKRGAQHAGAELVRFFRILAEHLKNRPPNNVFPPRIGRT